ILDKEKPNLVILTGDIVSGYAYNNKSKNWFKNLWNKIIEPMKKREIKWSIILGNHDIQGELNGKEILKLDMKNKLSYSNIGPLNIKGITNYYYTLTKNCGILTTNQILKKKKNLIKCKAIVNFWHLDSGDIGCN